MNYRFFCFLSLIFLIFFSFSVFAENKVIFSELGYESVFFDSMDEKCIELDFLTDLNSFEKTAFLSLHLEFFGKQNTNDKIKVFFNEFLLTEFNSLNLSIGSVSDSSFNAWKRIFVPGELINEKNKVKICIKTSNSTPKITFFNDSSFGFYSSSLFKENSFEMNLMQEPIAGKDISVEITLRNYGVVSQQVEVFYRKEELENRTPWVKFVSGKSSFLGEVPSCIEWTETGCIVPGEKTFSYLIRISKTGPLSILPAILNYENFFDEKISGKESNRLYLDVIAPKVQLTPFFIVPNSVFFVDEEIPLKLIVKNTGLINAPEINLQLISDELTLSSTSFNSFELNASESKEFNLIAFSSINGEFFIECNAVIPDYELNFSCEKTSIVFQEKQLPLELIASAILGLIAVIALFYFYFKKSRI
jgi:hypothetical protein